MLLRFLFVLKCESPYKNISLLTLSGKGSKLFETDFTLIIKIETILRKMVAVQEVMYCMFNIQSGRR